MAILGVSSIFMYPRSLIKTINKATELGLRHINIFAFPPHFKEDSEEFIKKVSKLIFDLGLDCSLKIQGYTINIAATNPNLRRESIDEAKYWIDVAGKLNCSCVIMRAGMFFYSERVFREHSFRILIKNLRPLVEYARDLGLTFLIENYPYPFDIVVLPSDITRLAKALKMRIYLMLNIPHLFDVYKTRKIDLDQEIRISQPFLRMVYYSDYMNPWDYPHKLEGQNYEKFSSLSMKVLDKIKAMIGTIVLIGYNTEEIKELKDRISRSILF